MLLPQFLVSDLQGLSHPARTDGDGPPQGYYRASHALARIARQMSRQLWRPATESDGIPLELLNNFMNLLNEWREEYLQHVGVPNNFDSGWDFVSAVTACEYAEPRIPFDADIRRRERRDVSYHVDCAV